MPKLWDETIQAHRHQVRDAILDTTAALVAEHGLLSVTMSQIAEATGIGRATLYKYFPDVEATLLAWHERQITGYVEQLAAVRDRAGDPRERLEAVLAAYANLSHEVHGHHDADLAAVLRRAHQAHHAAQSQHGEHREDHAAHSGPHGEPLAGPHQRLRDMLRDLVADAAAAGAVRDDVAPEELADFCVHALAGAKSLASKAAVDRLVTVTLDGLRPHR